MSPQPDRPLLMIPGPIEISPGVQRAFCAPPPSHLAPALMEAFGSALSRLRALFGAADDAQPFVIAGGGTLAMDSAVANVVAPGETVCLVDTGYFSRRMAEIVQRRGARPVLISGPEPGSAPGPEAVASTLRSESPAALFVTHVDTSSGVRTDLKAMAALAAEADEEMLVVADGVCGAPGERVSMEAWGVDVYLAASQKAVGLPPGLALLVASPRALARRQRMQQEHLPPLVLDWEQWRPIMEAYQDGRPAYFSTPATNLVAALDVGLAEIEACALDDLTGPAAYAAQHRRVALAMRAAFEAMELVPLPTSPRQMAHTISALRYPDGVSGPDLLSQARQRGVIFAGGLLPGLADQTFRVGHMGWVTGQPELLETTIRVLAQSLQACGHPADEEHATGELNAYLYSFPQKGR